MEVGGSCDPAQVPERVYERLNEFCLCLQFQSRRLNTPDTLNRLNTPERPEVCFSTRSFTVEILVALKGIGALVIGPVASVDHEWLYCEGRMNRRQRSQAKFSSGDVFCCFL